MDVDLALNLVSEGPDPCLVREVRVGVTIFVLHHGLIACIYLAEDDLVANVFFLLLDTGQVLPVDTDDVALVLLDTVSNHVLDESVEGLNLLVNDSVLLEIRVDDLPLVVHLDLVLTVV